MSIDRFQNGKNTPTPPGVFVRVANTGLTGYGTWKCVRKMEDEAATEERRHRAGKKGRWLFSDSWEDRGGVRRSARRTGTPLPHFSKVVILKVDKVLCFNTVLEVLILKDVRERQNRAKQILILKDLVERGDGLSARPDRVGISAPQLRCRSDLKVGTPERLGVVGCEAYGRRRGWARTIKGQGITKGKRCK